MKKLKLWALFVLLLTPLILLPSHAKASVQNVIVDNFVADYYISRDQGKVSQLNVEETITAEFPQTDQNHGIERAIPKTYQKHSTSLKIISVTDAADRPYSYKTRTEKDNTVLRIGDASSYVHGQKVYKINYSLRNVINFQTTDEFYWNVNGDQWPQPIARVTARLHVPRELADELTGQKECFSGIKGSGDKDCTITTGESNDETVITAQATNVGSRRTLTFDAGFKQGTFAMGPEIAAAERTKLLQIALSVVVAIMLPSITFAILYPKWRSTGKDPKGRSVIIPEYVAPRGLNVINSSFVLSQSVSALAISAGIIELAVHGYLQISEIDKGSLFGKKTDYQLKIVKDIRTAASEQQDVIRAMFGATTVGATTKISDQKNKLFTTVTRLKTYLAENLTTNGYFANNPENARKKYVAWAALAAILISVSVIALVGSSGERWMYISPIIFGLSISTIIVFIFSKLMPARTEKGVATRDYLLGLKEYIKLAEADRIKYLQSPQGAEKTPIDPNDPKQLIKLFEDLLPYAMLFGLEKDWAKQFNDLYSQPPGWYSGNMNTFNAIYLTNSLSGFSTANNTAFSAPSSSGSSGFGGGGFSGGGGGGGGGGGW